MNFYETRQRWQRCLSRLFCVCVAAIALVVAANDSHAQQYSGYNRAFPNDIYCGPPVCPPVQPMPWYPSNPGQQYAPAPFYAPQQLNAPRTFPQAAPMQQLPGRSLPDSSQSPQYPTQPENQPQNPNTPNGGTNSDTSPNNQTAPPSADAQSQVQNALNQNQGNGNPNNIFQASLEQELGGQGGDGFGGAGYGRGAQAPTNSIGDFFGGRLRARRSLIPMGQEFLFFPSAAATQIDYFRRVDTTLPSLLDNVAFQVDGNGVAQNTVQFSTTNRTLPVLGRPVNAIQADSIVLGTDPFFGGNITDVPNVTILDNGPFVLQTVDVLPGNHPDPFNPTAQRFTEDINRNGVLDPGEDLPTVSAANGSNQWKSGFALPPAPNGQIDVLDPPQTEVFGLYREIVLPSPGDMVGRLKVAENTNPIPRDRLIFDYTYFQSAGITPSGSDVQRFAPGVEKTLFGGLASVDIRLPFATTIESDIATSQAVTPGLAGMTNTSAVEIGNLSATGKVLLARNDFAVLSAGMQVLLPTASDVSLYDANSRGNSEILRIENKATHLMPFVAWQISPSDRFFVQHYLQYDRVTEGNPVTFRGNSIGTLEDVDFIYADISAGYWMYRNTPQTRLTRNGRQINMAIDGTRFLTGFAPRIELHYNRSLGDVKGTQLTDPVTNSPLYFGESIDKLESLNLTLGATMQFGIDKELTLAWGAPLMNQDESDFDNEFRVMFNWILPQ